MSMNKKCRTANTRLASCGVTCLHSSSVFQLGFCGRLTVLCSEIPHERQAWERYRALMKTLMKTSNLIGLILVFLTACCDKKETTYKKTNFKTSIVSDFIPTISGQITFVSDSNKTTIFNEVLSNHGFVETDNCYRGECCNEKLQYESKQINYRSTNDNFTFQLRITSDENTDNLSVIMTPDFPARQSLYGDAEYGGSLNFEFIANRLDTLGVTYLDSIIILGQTFKNIHVFTGKPSTWLDRLYAEKIYYSKTEGIVAYILNNKTIWKKV